MGTLGCVGWPKREWTTSKVFVSQHCFTAVSSKETWYDNRARTAVMPGNSNASTEAAYCPNCRDTLETLVDHILHERQLANVI
ncbi:hypothetical protein SCLCIDRAFT_1224866 [Scleroderma citrinum Foug A]|uniref:Uncharacterized protein n=1 Tax=Scleroderma citrinum Foug A TaxID=1036808 RepID=A0A0C3D4W8_9AGAM|nr:hypothetical protein SCLCIDRAFT_1224866 [Scleroderma citrinum Foug A]